MTKHSTLTNPDDLHYAKVRTFSGSPSAVTPDFPDQILIAWDTNKIYRSTWYNQGDLIELKTGGGCAIGNALPSRPTETGTLFYDQIKGQMYVSVQNSFNDFWWKPIQASSNFLSATFVNSASADGVTDVLFDLMYSEASIEAIEAGLFSNFTKVALSGIAPTETSIDLSYIFNGTGTGAYILGYSAANPNNVTLTTLFSNISSVPSGFEIRQSPYVLSANGTVIGTQYLYFSGEKPDNQLTFDGQLLAINIGG